MEYKITLANEKAYDILDSSYFLPADSTNQRNKLFLCMDNIELSDFVALLTKENLASIVFGVYADGVLQSETVYKLYDMIESMGQRRQQVNDITTGVITEKLVCFANLEQPTEIEQRLRELGVM